MLAGKDLHLGVAVLCLVAHHQVQSPHDHLLQFFRFWLLQQTLVAFHQLENVALEQFQHIL